MEDDPCNGLANCWWPRIQSNQPADVLKFCDNTSHQRMLRVFLCYNNLRNSRWWQKSWIYLRQTCNGKKIQTWCVMLVLLLIERHLSKSIQTLLVFKLWYSVVFMRLLSSLWRQIWPLWLQLANFHIIIFLTACHLLMVGLVVGNRWNS